MSILEKIKSEIAGAVNLALGKKLVKAQLLFFPPKPEFGDLSLACFNLAKNFNKSAVAMAEQMVKKIKVGGWLVGIKAIGPYLNFTISKTKLAQEVIEKIEKDKNNYGQNKIGAGKIVMIEYSNGNTHKEYHVGHLRNISFGDAVNKILAANGNNIIPVSYINDFGIHVAKTIWALEKFYKDDQLPANKGYFLGKVYEQACQEMDKNQTSTQEIGQIMKKIESKKGAEYKLWQKTRKWSLASFTKIYQELGVEFKYTFYESELVEQGLKMVAELYEKRFLTKSQGMIIADLENYNLGVLPIMRSDGTALYPVADLPLAVEKFKKYKIDESIYVVDVRQSQYFKQLFKVLELLGYKQKMVHLAYEFVKLPEGMMSSRLGRVITYEDLRAQAIKKALSETKKRHKDWADKKLNQVAERLVNGALKFEMLKVGADKAITFDISEALRFDGFTAAYLQYTYARIQSIIEKAIKQENKKARKQFEKLNEMKENNLVIKLAKYPEAVLTAGKNYDPSEIAKYLFELGKEFNDYYHSVPVLKAKQDVKSARLTLIQAVSQVIANGLALLGIETVEEM